jgi:hypothetical protein
MPDRRRLRPNPNPDPSLDASANPRSSPAASPNLGAGRHWLFSSPSRDADPNPAPSRHPSALRRRAILGARSQHRQMRDA